MYSVAIIIELASYIRSIINFDTVYYMKLTIIINNSIEGVIKMKA